MNALKTKLTEAAMHAAQAREWLQAAHSEACAWTSPPNRGPLAELAILPLLGEAVELERKIDRVLDAVKTSL